MARKKARSASRPASRPNPAAAATSHGAGARVSRTPGRTPLIALICALVIVAGAVAWWAHKQPFGRNTGNGAPSVAQATFVDEARCAACHAAEHSAWTGSHHDRAMQQPTPATVLGNFANAEFAHKGLRARFFERDGSYWISADGPDGKPADFHVKYTFGVDPLQQYLLELPRGRLQAYTAAWDVKRKSWFALYPDERIDFHDELHWTRPAQNWNYMCAECHSTDLRKNYDAATDTYDTTYFKINVGCQACHGPGSAHVEWADKRGASAGKAENGSAVGLEVNLAARDSSTQIESCARCHSRRASFWGDYRYGKPLMDTHLPSLLSERLYHADGQILEEVYEYGSFLQSKMHGKGVRCSDCHEPHSLNLRAEGNALCATCHNPATPAVRNGIDVTGLKHKDYDAPAHHFHPAGSPGAQCVNCHMPSRNYMVIDGRRDHSFRVPRPDLSVKIGTPNACTGCHAGKSAHWATQVVAQWYGPNRRQETHYGEALWAGRAHQVGAAAQLLALARDAGQPDIVRATALEMLYRYPGEAAARVMGELLSHSDPMLRRSALLGLEGFPPGELATLIAPLLKDPIRAIRMEAARAMAGLSVEQLGAGNAQAFAAALAEYEAAQGENGDRPEGHLNLGSLYAVQRKLDQAEVEFGKAIAIEATFVPAYVNLADLQRSRHQEQAAEATLRKGLRARDDPALHHVLGLALIRQKRMQEALAELALAAKQSREDSRYAYVYGVALHDLGQAKQGMSVLEAALKRFPGDRDLLNALASYAQAEGNQQAAARYNAVLQQIEATDAH